MPMRSVPHRVVCLLGHGRRRLPAQVPARRRRPHARRPARRRPRRAHRGPAAAARRAAGRHRPADRHLHRQRRAHEPRAAARRAGRRAARRDRPHGRAPTRDRRATAVEIRHPLQPFDPQELHASASSCPSGPWSFDPVTLNGARALATERAALAPFLAAPLPPATAGARRARGPRALRRAPRPRVPAPAARHQRRRLLRRGRRRAARSSSTPWSAGASAQRLLDGVPRGREHRGLRRRRDRARDAAPGPARHARDRAQSARSSRTSRPPRTRSSTDGAEPASVDVKVALDDGRTLSGTVPGVVRRRAADRHLLAGQRPPPPRGLRALARADGGAPRAPVRGGHDRAGRGRGAPGQRDRHDRPDPAARGRATAREAWRDEQLATLVDLYDRGMREPLPLACMTSAAYAAAVHDGADAEKAGRNAWESGWNFPKEDDDLEHQLVLGGILTFDELIAEPPRPDEEGDGWDDTETTRFGRYARRLWDGLLAARGGLRAVTGTTDIQPFDVCGPLPTGVTVLEASAGTGKTFTIAALAARYVAEGTPLEQLLLVTFTRMATGELRERVRERLVSAEQGLDRALAGAPPTRRGRRAAGEGHRRTRSTSGASASPEPSPTSTPRRSPPPTASARRCSAASASPATSSPTPPSSRTSATWSRRSSTTSTCAASTAATSRSSTARRPCGSRASRSTTRPCASSPSDAPEEHRRGDAPPARARRARRARAPQAPTGGHDLRRPAHPPRRHAQGPGRRGRGRAAARALPRRARRRVPGHRPGPVGHHAPRVRRRRHDARPHRRPQAGDLRLPRRRRLRLPRGGQTGRHAARRSTSTGAATRASSTPTTRCSAAPSSATRASSTARSGPRTPTRRRGSAARRSRRRCASGSSTATTPSLEAHARRLASATPRRASTSPRTSRPTSCALLSSNAEIEIRAEDGTTPAPRARPPRPRRRARPHQPQRRAGPRRARRGRRPRRHQRRRQRLRHRAGPRLAAPARGDRAAVVARARRLRRADPVPRLERPSGSRRPTRTTARSSTAACTSGRACCASRASPR